MASSAQTPLQAAQWASSGTPLPTTFTSAGTPFSTTSTSPLFQRVQKEGGSEYFFVDAPNAVSREDPGTNSHHNEINARVVREQVDLYNDRGVAPKDIVILSFYEAQVRLLKGIIQCGTNGPRGCKEICTVEAFAGRVSEIVILDFAVAFPVHHYDLDRYQTSTSTASCPKPTDWIRNPGRILTAITRGNNGLILVGQFALLVSWIFDGGKYANTIFCLAEDLFHRGLIVSRDMYVDYHAMPESDAIGPRSNEMVGRFKIKRDAFIRQKIQNGRQRLGIFRP